MNTRVKEIKLTGLSTAPNDYACEDGNLAIALGVVHEEGGLKNAVHSQPKMLGGAGRYESIYQHKINKDSPSHIIQKTDNPQAEQNKDRYLYLVRNEAGDPVSVQYFTELGAVDVKSVTSIGLVLIFCSEDSTYYYLWGNNRYSFLGTHLPELEMRFNLEPYYYDGYNKQKFTDRSRDDYDVILEEVKINEDGTLPDSVIKQVSDAVFARVNRCTGDWSNENGYFTQPFLVRYAYRLYDGTLTMHSSPVLMVPTTMQNPLVGIYNSNTDRTKFSLFANGIGAALKYKIKNNAEILRWKEIIKSVDVFVSAPIYSFDQSGKITILPPLTKDEVSSAIESNAFMDMIGYVKMKNAMSICNDDVVETYSILRPKMVEKYPGLSSYFPSVNFSPNLTWSGGILTLDGTQIINTERFYESKMGLGATIKLPAPLVDMSTAIKQTSNFYLLASIATDELEFNVEKPFEVAPGYMSSLVTKEVMTDDFESHHNVVPNALAVYNNRLHIGDVKKQYFKGFSPNVLFPMATGDGFINVQDVTIYIKDDGKTSTRTITGSWRFASKLALSYFYYPDPNAYKVVIQGSTESDNFILDYPLKEHEGLNGAVYYGKFGEIPEWSGNTPAVVTDNTEWFEKPYLMHSSETSNPFVMKAKNTESIGQGRIIALVPQAVAMSQGQFGQFPMICFTTDGIWALEVGAEGEWKAKQPFSRDVLLRANLVLQLDRDILFVTDRGLMSISGSKVDCISEVFDGVEDVFTTAYKQYVTNAVSTYTGVNLGADSAPSFRKYISGDNSSMHYDYTNQRVVCSNADYPFSFVFNMKDKLWTCVAMKLKSSVNSYPEALANAVVDSGIALVDLTKTDSMSNIGMPENGFILTRPIKFDDRTSLKTVTRLEARGTMHYKHVDLLLYVSNDLKAWKVGATSRGGRLVNILGTPYRFYRIGIVTSLQKDEMLNSIDVIYETRESLTHP